MSIKSLFTKHKPVAQFNGIGKPARPVPKLDLFLQKLYAVFEPPMLRNLDKILLALADENTDPAKRKKLVDKWAHIYTRKASEKWPKAIVCTTGAAENLLELAATLEGPKGARLAVGRCPCQEATKRWRNPVVKDITLFYGAEAYLSIKGFGYREITLEEGKALLRQCRDAGLVHECLYIFNSQEGIFAMCNCDNEACVPVRGKKYAGQGLFKGPEVVVTHHAKCVGVQACGNCLKACLFDFNKSVDGKMTDGDAECVGCGLCTLNCKGKARTMTIRKDYQYEYIMPKAIVLKGLYKEYE